MPYKPLNAEQLIPGTTDEEKAAARKALGFPDSVAVEKTQLMFNDELSYVVGIPDPAPEKSHLLSANFSIDHVIKSILTEVSSEPDKAKLQATGLQKSYRVPSANALWLGSFALPDHSVTLKEALGKAKALKSPEKEDDDTIIFLVCTQPNNQYEYCELAPDPDKADEWILVTSNPVGDERDTDDYAKDKATKSNPDLENIIALLTDRDPALNFKLSNIVSRCVFKQETLSGSGIAAVETVIDRLFIDPKTPIEEHPFTKMSQLVDDDIAGEPGEPHPTVSLEEQTRQRHAAIVMKAASRDNNKELLAGLTEQLKHVVPDDTANPLPVYLAGLNTAGDAMPGKAPAPADRMAPYHKAYIKELKLTQLDQRKKTSTNKPPAAEFRTPNLTWNMRAYNEHTKDQLTSTLIKKLDDPEVRVDAVKEDKTPATSSSDTAGYSIKLKDKTLAEISKRGVSVPGNWEEATPDIEKAAYTALTTFMSVSSSKRIVMTGADPKLCDAIKNMVKDNTKYPEFKDLTIIDNVSKAVPASKAPSATSGFKPATPKPEDDEEEFKPGGP